MREGQIKTRIFLIRAVDFVFFIGIFSFGIYSVLYSEHRVLMAIAALTGLFFVNLLGNIGAKKVRLLRQELVEIERKNRQKGRTI